MADTPVEDTTVEVTLQSAERVLVDAVTYIEILVEQMKAATDGDAETQKKLHEQMKKLNDVATTAVKERMRIDEHLRRERGASDRFALDLADARTKVREQLDRIAGTQGSA